MRGRVGAAQIDVTYVWLDDAQLSALARHEKLTLCLQYLCLPCLGVADRSRPKKSFTHYCTGYRPVIEILGCPATDRDCSDRFW